MALIVLAEADEVSAAATINALMSAGHAVAHFIDGAQAIEAIRFRHPHLVILDCDMPGLGGIGTLRVLRQREGMVSLPVLMLTARDRLADRQIARFEGANGHLVKPASSDELVYQSEALIRLSQKHHIPSPPCETDLDRRGRPRLNVFAGTPQRFC